MNPVISVIVPIYKVEEYLSRCIDSIINQTYKNLEIILVDDGSPDNCPKICDDYAKKDNRIKVIHKENGGLSDARNAGVRASTGEYIVFVDSDDWIELSMLDTLYNLLADNRCDVASCGIRMVWEDNRPSKLLFPFEGCHILEGTEYILDCLISNKYLVQTVWNKIYKANIIKNIDFPKGKINEDEYWSWQVIAKTNRVVCLDIALYNYAQRDGSIMRNSNFNPMFALEANCLRYEFVLKNYPALQDKCCINLLYSCLYQAQRAKLLLEISQYKTYYRQIKKIVKKHKPRKEYIKSINLRKKVRIMSIYYFFGMVCFVQNLLGIGNESNIV